jgi:arylsulfatase A-like enzyme
MSDRLNLLIYVTHDTGRHLGCYGNATVATPNVDRMAAEGVRFANHFCTSPGCSPSRGSIFTGRYPHNNGLMGLANWKWGWRLNKGEKHLAGILKQAGYQTALFGAHHEIDPDTYPNHLSELGYDSWNPKAGSALALPEIIAGPLREWAGKDSTRPFFACIGTGETHRPVFRPKYPFPHDNPDKVWVPPYLPDLPEVRRDLAAFHSLVKGADWSVGEILKLLDETGLSENTLFVFTTDHGIPYPRAKMSLYDPGIGTALIIRGPKGFRGGKVFSELMSNIDLLPTVLEAAGLPIAENVQGRSFLPLVQGRPYERRAEIFAEKTYHVRYDPMRCIRTEKFKYIRNWKLDEPLEMGDWYEIKREGKNLADYFAKSHPPDELFDLEKDPYELKNVAELPEYQPKREELRGRLMRFLEETEDPLLEGKPPYPKVPRSSPLQQYSDD